MKTKNEKFIIRKNYQYKQTPGITFTEPSLTKQSMRDETDINLIMDRFKQTGQLPEMIRREPSYGDFSDVESFQEAMQIVRHAHEQFEALPAKTRDRFANDPSRFLDFVNNPENQDEMVKLGLATKKEPKAPASPEASKEPQSQQPKPKND